MAALAQPAPVALPATIQQKTDWAPTAKVGTGALAGAMTVILMAFLGPHLKDWVGGGNPASVGAAITSILTFGTQYRVPERK